MENNSLGSIKLSRLKAIIEAVEKHNHDDIDMDLSAEFLIPSCFPELWKNFQNNINHQHTLGYIEGYNDGIEARRNKKNQYSAEPEENAQWN